MKHGELERGELQTKADLLRLFIFLNSSAKVVRVNPFMEDINKRDCPFRKWDFNISSKILFFRNLKPKPICIIIYRNGTQSTWSVKGQEGGSL